MNADTVRAKALLEQKSCTCAFCRNDETILRGERGVLPLLLLLESGQETEGFCAADRVVGSAAAFLYTSLRVREVYAPVMCERAVRILERASIRAYYDVCPSTIRNRQDTDLCPMERAVADCTTPEAALPAIKDTLQRISKNVIADRRSESNDEN